MWNETIAAVLLGALLALAGVYAYAAAALYAHARLAGLPPPGSLARAVALGALVPACGCTALAYARRAPARLRAPFLVAAYAINPLLVLAAGLVAGWPGALAVAALGVLASFVAAASVPEGERPRARLDDLLLRRGGSPLRDAGPYAMAFAAPALGIGALIGLVSALPALVGGLAVGGLALLFAAPHRDVAQDHGEAFARGVRFVLAGFALVAGVAVLLVR